MSTTDVPFKLRAVYSVDREYIPLKHIESINRNFREDCDEVVDKLKNDQIVRITTLSGKEHLISMLDHIDIVKEDIHTPEEMWEIIFNNWLNKVS